MMKRKIMLCVFMMFLMCACSKIEDVMPVVDTSSEMLNETAGQEEMNATEAEVTTEAVVETEEETEAFIPLDNDAVRELYLQFISDNKYEADNSEGIIFRRYAFYDLNEDGIDELILQEYNEDDISTLGDGFSMIYSYDQEAEKVVNLHVIGENNFGVTDEKYLYSYYGPSYDSNSNCIVYTSGEGHAMDFYQYDGHDIIYMRELYLDSDEKGRYWILKDIPSGDISRFEMDDSPEVEWRDMGWNWIRRISTDTGSSNVCDIQEIWIDDVYASSELYESYGDHYARYICDDSLSTAWVEGASGQGIGESICIKFDDTYTLLGFHINAGYQKNSDLYEKNSRPKEITLDFSDGSRRFYLLDDYNGEQTFSFAGPIESEYVILTIQSVYEGYKYTDTCISELSFY